MAVTRIHFKGFTAHRYYTIVTYHVRTSISNPYKGYCISMVTISKNFRKSNIQLYSNNIMHVCREVYHFSYLSVN